MFQREVAVHTGAKIMYDGKGTPISVANTPEAINEAISKGFNEVKAEEKLPESIRTVKAYKDLTPTEKAVFDKLHPGPKAAGGEKPPTKAEVQRGEVEFGKQLVPALAEFYPDLLGSKNIGDFSTKLTPAHKKAIDTGRKMLKEGSTPGEAADAVVALLGTPPVPKEELGWWDTATGAIKRVLSPKPAEQKPEEPGMIKKGNIDYSTRPNVNNPDGTHSSVVSKSFNFDGEEVLIPTISDDGKKLSDKEAINLYKKTGKHLGKFKTAKDADNYANAHHAEMGPKTAKLPDGKFYKDGDIYTDPKTKQKSIVRVK